MMQAKSLLPDTWRSQAVQSGAETETYRAVDSCHAGGGGGGGAEEIFGFLQEPVAHSSS